MSCGYHRGFMKITVAVAEDQVQSIYDLDAVLKKCILGATKNPEETAHKDLKSAFAKEQIDIDIIAQKCVFHAKEIEAGKADYAYLSEQGKIDREQTRKKELLRLAILTFCSDEDVRRCVEVEAFKEADFWSMIEKLSALFQKNNGESMQKAFMRKSSRP